jgi:hypothetical protein
MDLHDHLVLIAPFLNRGYLGKNRSHESRQILPCEKSLDHACGPAWEQALNPHAAGFSRLMPEQLTNCTSGSLMTMGLFLLRIGIAGKAAGLKIS